MPLRSTGDELRSLTPAGDVRYSLSKGILDLVFHALSRLVIAVAFAAIPNLAFADSTPAPAPVPGHIVVAKPTGDALIIWDCSDIVAGIVQQKTPDADANATLERDAAIVLSEKLEKLDASAKSITVRLIYQKTGAVSPQYGTATFAGVERYATLTLGKGAPSDRKAIAAGLQGNSLPGWVVYTITGTLPPHS